MFRGRTVFSGPQDDGTNTLQGPRTHLHGSQTVHVPPPLPEACSSQQVSATQRMVFLVNPLPRAIWVWRAPTRPLCAAPGLKAVCTLDSGMCSKGHQGSKTAFSEHCRSIPFISVSTLTAFREALTGNNIYLMKYHTASPQNHPFYLLTF